jgi:subtilisin-like proprotein convertase family protein
MQNKKSSHVYSEKYAQNKANKREIKVEVNITLYYFRGYILTEKPDRELWER